MDSWTDAADASEGGGPAPSIEVQNRSDQDTTLVRCGGFNRTGQLAALTIAISSFGLQIKSTFIRTDNDAADVDDLFYVQTREGEPVPLDQHDALVRHVERALGLPPSAVDTLQAARDAGFIGHAAHGSNDGSNAGVDHTYGGGYDERAQELAREEAAFREAQGSASRGGGGGGGGFFGDDVLGSSLFDPSTYASYGNSNAGSREEETHEAAEETQHHGGFFDTPHGPEVPDASFFDSQFDGGGGDAFAAPDPPAAPAAQASGGGFFGDLGGSSDFGSPPALSREQPEELVIARDGADSWNDSAGDSRASFDWSPDASAASEVGGGSSSSYSYSHGDDEDPAAVLSARLRTAAAEMAAAAADFVSLERDRAAALDAATIEALQQPRLDAQETLSRTMSSMQEMLKERDAMRNRAMGIIEEETEAYVAPSWNASVEAPPTPAWPEPRPYEPPTPRPYEPPTPRPYESWTPPESTAAPEFIPPSTTWEIEDSFDEDDIPFPPPLATPLPPPKTPMGGGDCIMLQGFNWESCNSSKKWFNVIADEAREIKDAGFTAVWLPPPTDSVSDQGYLPRDLYNLNSFYGNVDELRNCVRAMNDLGVTPVADIVINHRCADGQDESGRWNLYSGRMAWDQQAITTDNPEFGGRGAPGTGEDYGPAPNIDHTKDWVREDLKRWMHWMKSDIGFGGWRFDFVKGYGGQFTGEYVADTAPAVSVGEHWVSCNYNGGNLEYDQESHRQSTFDWCQSTGGNTAAFDFTTKGILQEAVRNREYWRLQGHDGHPSGFNGKWPTHAVTFLENHDTGSTLQHWPFPTERLPEGYAYILTHPGTPTVFYDHWKDGALREDIQRLMDIRARNGIQCNAAIHIERAEDGCYAAHIGSPRKHVEVGCCHEIDLSKPSICMKLGPGDWSPNRDHVGDTKWKCQASGDGWAVWEDKRFLR